MNPQLKQLCLDIAEIVDAARLFPRLFCAAYGILGVHMHAWYISIPNPTTEQSVYAGAIIGLCAPLLNWYMSTGRKWQS